MKIQNSLAKRVDAAGIMASYDEACKQVLANKIILAWIIKYSTKDYSDYSVEEIAEKYIDGEPKISKESVHRDETPYPDISLQKKTYLDILKKTKMIMT